MAQLNDLLVLGESKLLNPLPVESGGTGANNPGDALKNLNIVNEFGGVNIGEGANSANSGGAVGSGAYADLGFAGGEGANTFHGGAVGWKAKSINGFAGGNGAKVEITRDFSIAHLFSAAESILNIDEDIFSFIFILPEKIFKIYNIEKILIFNIENQNIYVSFGSNQIIYKQNKETLEIKIPHFLPDITILENEKDSFGFIILGESNGDYAYSNNEIEIVTDFNVNTSNKIISFITTNPDPIKKIILYSNTDIASSLVNNTGQHFYQATLNLENINFGNVFLDSEITTIYLNSSNELVFDYGLSYNPYITTMMYDLKKGDFYKIEIIREPAIESGGAAVGADSSALDGFAGGQRAKALALGAVQLGEGINETVNTLKFREHKISNGSGILYGTVQSSGADTAEQFEWADSNINNEDRRGYFVTVDTGEKIRIANSNDDYILGVISSKDISSFISNTAYDGWHNKYLRDVYGDYILEEKLIPEKKDKITGEIIVTEHTEIVRAINPEYDENREYVSRIDRPEWAVVCFMGQIVVNDNGTCKVNEYCKVSDNGSATAAGETDLIKYRVIKRIDDSHVKIIFK